MVVTRDKGVTVLASGNVFIDKEGGLVRVRVPKGTDLRKINIDSRLGSNWCASVPEDPAIQALQVHVTFDDLAQAKDVIIAPTLQVFDASFADDINSGGYVSNEFLAAGAFKVTRLNELELLMRVDNICTNYPLFIVDITF